VREGIVTGFSKGLFYESQHSPDLRHRILYTVLLLLLFRLLAAIPVLNVDEERLQQLLADNPLLGAVDLFAGGEVLTRFSVAAAGILPYLMALVLVQGATWVAPPLRELRRQGEKGKERIEFYAKLLTVPLAFIFAWAISQYLAQQTGLFPGQIRWFTPATFFPSLKVVFLVTGGSLATTWITNLITKKGVGSGESIVLLCGASLVFHRQIIQIVHESPHITLMIERLGFVVVGGLAVVVLSFYLTKAVRRIPITATRQTPSRSSGSGSHIPIPLNRDGILPVSAAIGLLALMQFAQVFLESNFGGRIGAVGRGLSAWTTPSNGLYWIALVCLIVLFVYICNFSQIWRPFSNEDLSLAESLKRHGFFISGVRPGNATDEYLSGITARITLPGSLGLAFLAAGLPYLILRLTGQNMIVTVLSLIVVVKTINELRDRIQGYWLMESYEGFIKPSKKGV